MRIENEIKLDFDDVLIRPKRSTLKSRADVDLKRVFNFLHCSWSWEGVPIIASNMDTVGTIDAAIKMWDNDMLTWLHKFVKITKDDAEIMEHLSVAAAVTLGQGDTITQEHWTPSFIRIDVANGYRESFVEYVKMVRNVVRDTCVIFAGNVVTPEQTEELLLNGADVVVVGIGSGGMCTTRVKSGVGYPQVSAIIECADAAHGLGGHIVADGGCRLPGDVAKAFAAGADFVSLGTMLAGHEENTAEENKVWIDVNGLDIASGEEPTHVKCYGMSSEHAMNKYYGGVAKHRSSEGREELIPWRGPIQNTIDDILGGVRSTCTYVGAKKLKELTKRTTFIRVNRTHNDYWSK